jgi:hypothetical protein
MLDVPVELVSYLAGLLAAERLARGTRSGVRALSCQAQAIFGLIWFRERRDVALIGKGLGISQATAYRYLDEVIEVLADQAPDLHETLQRAHLEGWSYVNLDGKVVATSRLREKLKAARARPSTPGTRAKHTTSAATSKPSPDPTDYRYGSQQSNQARSTT